MLAWLHRKMACVCAGGEVSLKKCAVSKTLVIYGYLLYVGGCTTYFLEYNEALRSDLYLSTSFSWNVMKKGFVAAAKKVGLYMSLVFLVHFLWEDVRIDGNLCRNSFRYHGSNCSQVNKYPFSNLDISAAPTWHDKPGSLFRLGWGQLKQPHLSKKDLEIQVFQGKNISKNHFQSFLVHAFSLVSWCFFLAVCTSTSWCFSSAASLNSKV